MKKLFSLLLALSFALSLAACHAPSGDPPTVTGGSGFPAPLEEEAGFSPFSATILEIEHDKNSILVLADEGAEVRSSADRFWVSVKDAGLAEENGEAAALRDLRLFDRVEVGFTGGIAESYPAQITADQVTRLAKRPLTREDVAALAEKGGALDWVDFAPYESVETGSGLFILRLDIDGEFRMMVGGSPVEQPMYARVCRASTDDYLDLLTDGEKLEDFFAGMRMVVDGGYEVASVAPSGDYPAAIRIEGKVYLLGPPMPAEVEESAILGKTTSYTDGWPREDGQTNFSREPGLPYARVEGGMAVLYENEWHFCDEYK